MHCISPVSSQLYMYARVTSKKDYFIAYLITYFWNRPTTLLKFFVQKTSIQHSINMYNENRHNKQN